MAKPSSSKQLSRRDAEGAFAGGDAESFIRAIGLWCDMEEGRAGRPDGWQYPPPGKMKVSVREIGHRLGDSVVPYLDTPVFHAALELERNFRTIEELGENHAASRALDIVCDLGLKYMARQLLLADAGLESDVKFSTLSRDLPRLLRLKWEKEGKIEAAGVSVNMLTQNINVLEDPAARARAYEVLSERLSTEAAQAAFAEELEGEAEDAEYEPVEEAG